MLRSKSTLALSLILAAAAPLVRAQDPAPVAPQDAPPEAEVSQLTEAQLRYAELVASMDWVRGPGDGRLGERAKIAVPEGYSFTVSIAT